MEVLQGQEQQQRPEEEVVVEQQQMGEKTKYGFWQHTVNDGNDSLLPGDKVFSQDEEDDRGDQCQGSD